ncbi:MAG: FecR domain-containing protein [Anaerolineales bacterium]|nr:FecR domain-containing protein [Anaerolineales bacterium]
MNRKMILLLAAFVMIVFAASCQQQEAPASPLSAALSELSGTVDAKQAADDAFAPAAPGTVLQANGQIQTGDDGRVRLDLSSGTIIRVTPSSIFTLTSNEEVEGGLATKIKLDLGKIFIILNGGSADVETPSGVASVRGSYMKVEVDPETMDIYVTCLEGNCSVSNPAGTVNFSNGERAILYHRDPVTGNWTAPNVEPMTPAEFQEWLDENPEAKELYEQAMATVTALAQPTEAPTATPSLVTATASADASSACFKIIEPAVGASLPKQGRVNFEWEAQPGAERYIITFVDQNGNRAVIETTSTSEERYIEILPAGGNFSWFVTSYGADGNEICSTESSTFTKPQGDPTQRPSAEPDTDPPACDPNDCSGACPDYYYCSDF